MNNNDMKNYDDEGLCPLCGKGNLEYGERDFNGDGVTISVKCEDCNTISVEHYSVEYIDIEIVEIGVKDEK